MNGDDLTAPRVDAGISVGAEFEDEAPAFPLRNGEDFTNDLEPVLILV